MSDFIQVTDRVPTLPNRKKITYSDNSVEYATIEYADSPSNAGTAINKNLFNKINTVLGYNECTVSQTSTTSWNTYAGSDMKSNFQTTYSDNEGSMGYIYYSDLNNKIDVTYSYTKYTLYGTYTSNSTGTFTLFKNCCSDISSSTAPYGPGISASSGNPNTAYFYFSKPIKVKKVSTSCVSYSSGTKLSSMGFYFYNDDILQTSFTTTSPTLTQKSFDDYITFDSLKITLAGNSSYVVRAAISFDDIMVEENVKQNNIIVNDGFNGTYTNNQHILISTPSNLSLDSVTTNTINGVTCDSILKPNSKYELLYNSSSNKFEIVSFQSLFNTTLFDITLDEAVSTIELTGISKMLELGKLYCLIISGEISGYGDIYFGGNSVMYADGTNIHSPFVFNVNIINNVKYVSGIYQGNGGSSTLHINSVIENTEKIYMSSLTFNAGTRIVIKEVA